MPGRQWTVPAPGTQRGHDQQWRPDQQASETERHPEADGDGDHDEDEALLLGDRRRR
jgi:hypothetical protein